MTPSGSSADGIAKNLYHFLTPHVPASELFDLGWAGYLASDCDGCDATNAAVAAETLIYFAISSEGFDGGVGVRMMAGMVKFLKHHIGKSPTHGELKRLKETLDNGGSSVCREVRDWFNAVYG